MVKIDSFIFVKHYFFLPRGRQDLHLGFLLQKIYHYGPWRHCIFKLSSSKVVNSALRNLSTNSNVLFFSPFGIPYMQMLWGDLDSKSMIFACTFSCACFTCRSATSNLPLWDVVLLYFSNTLLSFSTWVVVVCKSSLMSLRAWQGSCLNLVSYFFTGALRVCQKEVN